MEIKVVNALNRDIEREQLNKILKYLNDSIISSTEKVVTEVKAVERVARAAASKVSSSSSSSSSSSAPAAITVSLTGDVEGTGQGTSSITVPVNITKDLVEEAPIDSGRYWRYQGGWETVPFPLLSLAYMSPSGFGAYNEDEMEWISRKLEGDSVWTTVNDGDGVSGDPEIVFTESAKEGYKRIDWTALGVVHGARAVVVENSSVRHPSLTVISDAVKIVGISTGAALDGQTVTVQTGGTISDSSWAWSAGDVFAGQDGVLTQVAPTTGYVTSIGRAISPTTININITIPLIRKQ